MRRPGEPIADKSSLSTINSIIKSISSTHFAHLHQFRLLMEIL